MKSLRPGTALLRAISAWGGRTALIRKQLLRRETGLIKAALSPALVATLTAIRRASSYPIARRTTPPRQRPINSPKRQANFLRADQLNFAGDPVTDGCWLENHTGNYQG